MRLYSKFRPLLLAVLLAAAFVATRYAYSADAPADASGSATPAAAAAPATGGGAPAAPHTSKTGVFSLILDNIDPIFIIIALLSVTGLTLIIQGFIKARRAVIIPDGTTAKIRELIGLRQFQQLLEFTEQDPSFVSQALYAALKRAPRFEAMKEAMETAIGEQTADEFRRIEYLNIIGNLGPLLGLMGTVLGMIYAFQAMYEQGGMADPTTLAGGISKALAHTFLGLALALPCLAAFGVLRTLIDRLTVQAALTAEELLLMVKPQGQGQPAAGAAPVAATAAQSPATAPVTGVIPPRPVMPAGAGAAR